MKCKSAEYYISLYLDGTIDTATEELLLKHIETCEHCSAYLEQSLEIHELTKEIFEERDLEAVLSSTKIMEEIYKENMVFRTRRLRMKPAVMAAVLALVMVFIPINSKTVLAYGIDWVRSLIIREPGLVMIVEDRATAMSHEPRGGKTVVLQEDNQYLKTVGEVMAVAYEAEKKPCLPVDMVEGYVFDGAIYGRYSNDDIDDFYIESYYIRQDDPSTQKDNITVKLNYGMYLSGFKTAVSEKELTKEIAADSVRGLLIKRDLQTGYVTYEAYFILNKQGVKLQIKYRTKEEPKNIETDIIKIAAPLLEKIKKEVPEGPKKEIKNVSTVYESNKEDEFNQKIAGLDDRIVKISIIPTSYMFKKGIFIDNPKEIDMFSLSSDYYATYTKGDSKLFIRMQLHTHSEKNSDFETHDFGEVIQREPLAGYTARVYKETTNFIGSANGKTISVDMPDYAVTLSAGTTSSEGHLLSDQDLKTILTGIIDSIKEKAVKRQIVSLGRTIKNYDNLEQLINSEEIKKEGFIIPSYIPENSFFYNAKYEVDQYVLQFGTKMNRSTLSERIQPITTIQMRKSDIPYAAPFADKDDTKEIKIVGRTAYFTTKTIDAREGISIKSASLNVDLINERLSLTVRQLLNADEIVSEKEIIKIAESILKQMK